MLLGHVDEHGVPPGDDQAHVRRLRRAVLQEVRVDVPLEVVHPDQGHVEGQRDGLGRGESHEERTDEPGTPRRGHGLDLAPAGVRLPEPALEQRVQALQVRPGRELRDHAPEARVDVVLAREHVRADLQPVLHHGHRGLVAGGLDPQHPHSGRTPSGNEPAIEFRRASYSGVRMSSVHMTRASSCVSW